MSLIANEIEAHYLQAKESERLQSPLGELERLRTEAILARYLSPAPAVIFDVGGAAGAYAISLAKKGYRVHLIDPVDVHLAQAEAYAAASGVELASIKRGDARQLNVPSASADAVLMFGPLYHLVEPADRSRAISEARRILKPNGVLFAAAISRFASLMAGLAFGTFQDPEFRKIVGADLSSGQHRNPTDKVSYFTTAYFHRPDELVAEVRGGGFDNVEVLAVEGPVWSATQFQTAWNDFTQRQSLMDFLSLVEGESSILGASAHLMAVGVRGQD